MREEAWAARLLRKVVPAANPDFEPLYGGVRLWWVEVDDGGRPQREIGFGSGSDVLVSWETPRLCRGGSRSLTYA